MPPTTTAPDTMITLLSPISIIPLCNCSSPATLKSLFIGNEFPAPIFIINSLTVLPSLLNIKPPDKVLFPITLMLDAAVDFINPDPAGGILPFTTKWLPAKLSTPLCNERDVATVRLPVKTKLALPPVNDNVPIVPLVPVKFKKVLLDVVKINPEALSVVSVPEPLIELFTVINTPVISN